MQLTLQSNLKQIEQQLAALKQRGTHLYPVFKEIANALLNETENAFEKQASPMDGSAWQPLAESTLKQKKGKGKILYDQGTLQGSLTTMATPTAAIIGLNAQSKGYAYPAVHQFGSNDGTIPARPFLPFTAQGDLSNNMHAEIMTVLQQHFNA